ncbi:MAG: nucleotide sugar dehydrogenase [Acidobacteriia bacterium]|nr:nucleotide sugar dehydrogenase [Terriglobia bacterium]
MKVCVLGLWHLGTVTAACLASAGHDVTGIDFDPAVVAGLAGGTPPVFEPGLEDLVKTGLASFRLRFTTDVAAVAGADAVWIAWDTPIDDEDRADVEYVIERTARLFPHLRNGAFVLVSSQVPVGTTRRLEQAFASESQGRVVGFAYSPENLRLGRSIAVFTQPDRVVVGVRTSADRENVTMLLRPFAERIEWMSVESAEMTKHALNAFLATSITFINEIAAVCEQVGADASEVERGLKSESRIGPKAYLSPGSAFAGGTLARDVVFFSQLGQAHGVATHLLSSVKASNDAHRTWAAQRLDQSLKGVSGKAVAVWGLTYKPGTDTLRRSSSIELCQWLIARGATVRAHDPAVRALPAGFVDHFSLAENALSAVQGASALVVATPWPEYGEIAAEDVTARMIRPLVIDANRSTGKTLGACADIEYVSVGKAGTRR